MVEDTTGAASDSTAATLYAMADAELKLGSVDIAEAHQRRALSIVERTGISSLEYSNFVAQLGRIVLANNHADEAYRLETQALAIRRGLRPAEPELVAQSQNDLGVVFQVKGDFSRARDFYAQALAALEATGAEASLTYGGYLRDYGAILYLMGDYPAAEGVARRALGLAERIGPAESLDVAHSASFLGLVLAKEGRNQEAIPFHRRALVVRERELGPRHDLTLASLVFLAQSVQAQGSPAAAEGLWRRYLAVQESRLGRRHVEVGAAAARLSECLHLIGKNDEADGLFLRSLEIAKDAKAKNLSTLVLRLSDFVEMSQNAERWESISRDIVRVARKTSNGQTLDLALALEAYGRILAERHKCDDADVALDEASEIVGRRLGPSNIQTRVLLHRIDSRRCGRPGRPGSGVPQQSI